MFFSNISFIAIFNESFFELLSSNILTILSKLICSIANSTFCLTNSDSSKSPMIKVLMVEGPILLNPTTH